MTYQNQPEIKSKPGSATGKRLVRLKEAAAYLSLSPWKLRNLVWAGRLPVVQDCEGSPFLFDQYDLDSYVEQTSGAVPSDSY